MGCYIACLVILFTPSFPRTCRSAQGVLTKPLATTSQANFPEGRKHHKEEI